MSLVQLSSKPPDLDQLSKQLAKIGQIGKCEGCGCYVDTISEFKAVLDQTPDAPAPARERIAELEAKHQPTHGCIGCDPCYPVAISNTLYAISDGASVENVRPTKFDVGQNEAGCGTSCCYEAPQEVAKPASVAPRQKIAWPIETGDYRLGSDDGCVAIATLASEALYHHFSDTTCGDCAICGRVFTENIGIEKVVKNIIANRHIRFLILCGQEAKGHLTGACFKALHANGLADSRRIAGAPGKRPWIKTLSPAQILHFQRQIEIVDLIGCEEVAAIENTVAELAARNPGPLPEAIIAEGVPRLIASETGRLQLDKAGFFIIHPKPEADWLIVEHYQNSGESTCVIEGTDPAAICAEIINRRLVSQLDHAAYLGRELERAKLSIKLGFAFTQDRAFGELETKAEW
jgi:tetrahydromethanopterin S-methyltransferase subunit A